MRQRIHKLVHRISGGAIALIGVAQTFQAVDLAPLLGANAGAKVLAITGLFVCSLEFLPVLIGWFEEDEAGC